jgi:hypothetical protein
MSEVEWQDLVTTAPKPVLYAESFARWLHLEDNSLKLTYIVGFSGPVGSGWTRPFPSSAVPVSVSVCGSCVDPDR